MRRWFTLGIVPVAIGAAVLIIPWLYLGWNTTIGELAPAVRFRTKQTIAGAVQEAAPNLSLHAMLTGRFQQSISRTVGLLSPIYKPAIRWKNQLYYTLLGASGTNRVVVGRHRELLEIAYLNEYCTRNLATLRPKAEEWAGQIRAMQDFFAARQTPFVYVITPSKVAQYPQFVPASYSCPAGSEDRARKLEVYDEILRRHGIHFVDGAADLAAARDHYGIDMFPRGGVHWNKLAEALAAQQVIAAINQQRTAPLLANFRFTWRVTYTPDTVDRDLLDIMNMPYADAHYPVPELSYQPAQLDQGTCHPAKITEVGGSFLIGLNNTLGEALDCPPEIAHWFYFDRFRFRYAQRQMQKLPVDATARRQSLLDADAVLFEENEAALPQSVHGQDFSHELDTMRAGG